MNAQQPIDDDAVPSTDVLDAMRAWCNLPEEERYALVYWLEQADTMTVGNTFEPAHEALWLLPDMLRLFEELQRKLEPPPEGYAVGDKPPPAAVLNAWLAELEQLRAERFELVRALVLIRDRACEPAEGTRVLDQLPAELVASVREEILRQ